MKLFSRTIFLMILLAGVGLQAAPEKTEIKKKVEQSQGDPEDEKATKKKIGVDQSDFMPSANSFGLIVSYAAFYDDLEQVDQKTVQHRVSFAGTYSFDKYWSSYGALGFSHQSYGSNIVKENDNDDFHEISDLNLGLVYTKMNPLSFVSRSSNTLNVGLPVSERARVDKHIANISLTNFMQSHSWNRFSLFNRFTGNFIWNTQRFSTFMNDEMNRDWLISNSFGFTYMITNRWGARWNFRADTLRSLDGSWELSFGDNISTFANISGFQIFASMVNNSYQENERVDLGYYDKYRRFFLGGVTYAF